jgi:hypothetical protein
MRAGKRSGMKLVLYTLMIFFGTLVAAALVALGEPVDASFFPVLSSAWPGAPR